MDFIKVASACPVTKVGDVNFNLENILKCIKDADSKGAKEIVFPELAITSYTCSDLFLNSTLIRKSEEGIKTLLKETKNLDILISVGAPLLYNKSLYNCAYIIYKGSVLGIVTKSYIYN